MELKEIKKALMQKRVRISDHTFKRMTKRGYTRSDIITCLMQGELTGTQFFEGRFGYVVEGFDKDGSPMVTVVGHDRRPNTLRIITVMPPIAKRFKKVI